MLRPLSAFDEAAWTDSMRANETRMRPWWGIEGDWGAHTDRVAFAAHYTQWAHRARNGTGVAFALCTPQGLVGELLVWNIDAGEGTAELGLWVRPGAISGRVMLALLGGGLDLLFQQCGLERLSAPVAVGNMPPRKVLEISGFVDEGTLSGWRRLGGRMVDHDMYGLTPARWEHGRRRIYALRPWEPVVNPPA